VDETSKRLHDGAAYSSHGEDETDAHLLRVRELLSSLPKESCPAGFEFRLNRRLQGAAPVSGVAKVGCPVGSGGIGLYGRCRDCLVYVISATQGTIW